MILLRLPADAKLPSAPGDGSLLVGADSKLDLKSVGSYDESSSFRVKNRSFPGACSMSLLVCDSFNVRSMANDSLLS